MGGYKTLNRSEYPSSRNRFLSIHMPIFYDQTSKLYGDLFGKKWNVLSKITLFLPFPNSNLTNWNIFFINLILICVIKTRTSTFLAITPTPSSVDTSFKCCYFSNEKILFIHKPHALSTRLRRMPFGPFVHTCREPRQASRENRFFLIN